MNGAFVGSALTMELRPRLMWVADGEDRDDVRYRVQLSSSASFATIELETEELSETSFQPVDPLPVSFGVPIGRRYYWRVQACGAVDCSEYSQPRYFNLGRSPTDFNGDGLADVIVGAPETGTAPGFVSLYIGARGVSFPGVLAATVSGTIASSRFGISVSSAGDFNGDGFSDLLVGAPGTGVGVANIFFGGPGIAVVDRADITLSAGATGDRFGTSVADAGDVNGDGYSDVVVGAPDSGSDGLAAGRAYAFFGGTSPIGGAPTGVFGGGALGTNVGSHVTAAGDVNGDGFADIGVSRSDFLQPTTLMTGCSSKIYLGGPGVMLDVGNALDAFDRDFETCQLRVTSAGDLDGDGLSDLLLGINRAGGRSLMRVAPGVSAGDLSSLDLLPLSASKLLSLLPGAEINGDGFVDILVARQETSSTNAAYLGQPTGDGVRFPAAPSLQFPGAMIASPGDINGDGFPDVITGDSSGQSVLVYLSNAAGVVDTTSDGVISSPHASFASSSLPLLPAR